MLHSRTQNFRFQVTRVSGVLKVLNCYVAGQPNPGPQVLSCPENPNIRSPEGEHTIYHDRLPGAQTVCCTVPATSSLQNRFQAGLSPVETSQKSQPVVNKPVISQLDRPTKKKAKAHTSQELSERLCNYTQPLGCHPTGLRRARRRMHEAWLGGHRPRQSSGLVAVPSNTGLLP